MMFSEMKIGSSGQGLNVASHGAAALLGAVCAGYFGKVCRKLDTRASDMKTFDEPLPMVRWVDWRWTRA